MAFTGNFDAGYFPDIIYIPEFERYMNINRDYCRVFEDKNLITHLTDSIGVKTPHTLFSCTAGLIMDNAGNILTNSQLYARLDNMGEAFIKPTIGTSSGNSCYLINFSCGKDRISGKSPAEIISGYGKNWVIQERLQCHSSIARIYPHSVNTFRVITYRWKDEFLYMPAAMRMGRGGSNLDNVHAGGICIAIEDDGSLHSIAFTEFLDRFTQHPDTGLVFEGYRIPGFPKVIDAALKCHQALPQIGVINRDFTIDAVGDPVLIEANTLSGSVGLSERTHGKGPFGDKTVEVLCWMRKMRSLKRTEWDKYAFGNINGI